MRGPREGCLDHVDPHSRASVKNLIGMKDELNEKTDETKDFNALCNMHFELLQRLGQKNEQREFLADVIAEKQALCQQAKDQHEEKVRALARQARRHRVRRGVPTTSSYQSAWAVSPDQDACPLQGLHQQGGSSPSSSAGSALGKHCRSSAIGSPSSWQGRQNDAAVPELTVDSKLCEHALGGRTGLAMAMALRDPTSSLLPGHAVCDKTGRKAASPTDIVRLREALTFRLHEIRRLTCNVTNATALLQTEGQVNKDALLQPLQAEIAVVFGTLPVLPQPLASQI